MRQKGFAPVIILLVVLLLGVLGYFAFTKGYVSVNLPKPSASVIPSPIPSPSSSTDPTANWKTYSDDLHGITFKYPLSWTLTEKEGQSEKEIVYNSSVELIKADAKINMIFNVDGIGGMPTTYEGKPFTLDGHKLFQFNGYYNYNNTKIVGISDSLTTLGVFRINNITYLIHLTYPATFKGTEEKNLLQEFDQILSTFKFKK